MGSQSAFLPLPLAFSLPLRAAVPGGGGGGPRLIPGQDLAPKVFFLFTSADKNHTPYFSQTPTHTPFAEGAEPPEIDANTARCFAYLDK